jgi:hypothetical protein
MNCETLSCEAAALTTRKSGLWKVQIPDGDTLRQFHAVYSFVWKALYGRTGTRGPRNGNAVAIKTHLLLSPGPSLRAKTGKQKGVSQIRSHDALMEKLY